MSSSIAAKRPGAAVAAKRPGAAIAAKGAAARAPRTSRAAALEDDAPATNYALQLTDGLDDDLAPPVSVRPTRGLRPNAATTDESADDTFALRLSQALEAISAAQTDERPTPPPPTQRRPFLASLNSLPPIRLPIGPAIPWKIGLPLFVAVVVLMGVMSRTASQIDQPGIRLPAQQTYPVQDQAPLFAKPQPEPTDVATADSPVASSQPQAQQPLGVQDPGAPGFDVVDLGIKLVAVLALAYGSLMVLKKLGVGGTSAGRGSAASAVRVISSLALAPNRSVHVVEVPGGKTLLIGATPNSVNLLADLSESTAEK